MAIFNLYTEKERVDCIHPFGVVELGRSFHFGSGWAGSNAKMQFTV